MASAALAPISIALDWYINPDQAPILIAQANGYFKAHDLDVTLLTPTEETEPMKLVETNQATFGITNQLSLMMAIAQGAPVIRVAGLTEGPISCIASLNPTIKNIKDFSSKTIGYSAGGSLSPEMLRYWLQKNGVDPTTVKLVNVKMDLVQALIGHRIDAAADVVRSVEVVELEQMGYHPTVFYPEQSGLPTYQEMILFANTHELNPTVVSALIAALTQAEAFISKHPQQSFEIAKQYYPQALAPTATMAKTNYAIWMATVPYFTNTPGQFNTKEYQTFSHFLDELGVLHAPVPLNSYSIF